MEVQCMPNGYLEAMERRVVTETAGVLAEWERMKHRARENGKPMPKVGPSSLPPSLSPDIHLLCIHACPALSAVPPFGLPYLPSACHRRTTSASEEENIGPFTRW